MNRGAWVVLMCVALAGCPKVRIDPDDAALAAALADADAAWDARGRVGLARVHQILDGVPATRQDHPEVLWRRARVGVAQGWSEDEVVARRRAFAQARAWGMRCIQGVPAARRLVREGRVVEAASAVPLDRLRCAAWAGVAWTRWLVTWERTASTVDLRVVEALLHTGDTVADHDIVMWSKAVFEQVRPLHLREGAEVTTQALVSAGQGRDVPRWVWWEDVVRWVQPPPERRKPQATPRTPEDRAAHARLTSTD